MEENTALTEIDKAQKALDRANDIQEIINLRDKVMAMQVFAAAQGFEEAAQKAKIYQLKAERKAGDWLEKNVRQGGHNSKSQDETLLPNGVDKYESSRWQTEASVPEETFNEWIDECLSTKKEISAAGLRRMASSYHVSDDSYEWFTPVEYIEAARGVMGSIDLDPATSIEAQEVIQAKSYYTKDDDGLSKPWFGNVWLNPPYNMPLIERFVDRIVNEYKSDIVTSAIVLTNNSTDTGWFHRLLEYPVCFTRGRIQFWNGDDKLATRQGQAIFYLGKDTDLFAKLFSLFGEILKRYDY